MCDGGAYVCVMMVHMCVMVVHMCTQATKDHTY